MRINYNEGLEFKAYNFIAYLHDAYTLQEKDRVCYYIQELTSTLKLLFKLPKELVRVNVI